MNKKLIAILSVAGVGVAGTAFALFVHAQTVTATESVIPPVSAKDELNQDLIQAQVDLKGWQQETNQGNLTSANSAEYKTVFASDLASMHGELQSDSNSL